MEHLVDRVAERIARVDGDIAVDTETTGVDLYAGDVIRGVSVAWRDGANLRSHYFPISHPDTVNVDVEPLLRALHDTPGRLVFHNAGFDWTSLAQIGLAPRYENYYDTTVVAWLQNENDPSALKQQGQRWLGADANAEQTAMKAVMAGYKAADLYARIRPGIRKGMTKLGHEWAKERAAASKKTWATLTGDDIAEYAAKDTELTLLLDELQHKPGFLDEETSPWPAVPRELQFQGVIHRIVKQGVRVDLERAHTLALAYNARIAEIEVEIGLDLQRAINIGSTQQLSRLVYDEWGLEPRHFTPGGAPSVNKEALLEMEGDHPGVGLILEHRALTKMVGTYLDPMQQWADSDSRVHSSLNPIGTVTGRLSSSHPNMQNIPKEATDDTVKKLYIPSEGFRLFEFDLHSAELYVGASITGDVAMQKALSEPGRNFHKETAQGIFGSVEEPYYTLAKNLNYGIPYGIGPAKFALYLVKGLRKPYSEALVRQAKSIIDRHKRLWPVTHKGIRNLSDYAETHDYLPMVTDGRFRHFGGWRISVPFYTAFNAAVQGGVAEIMKLWMIAAEGPLAELGARIVLQVHDSLWIEVPPGMDGLVEALLQQVLDDVNVVSMRLTIDSKRLN